MVALAGANFLGRGCGLRSFGPVAGAALFAVLDALRVQFASDDMVTYTGQILHSSAADQHHGVFLQIVPFTGNIGVNFNSVG